MFLAILDQTDRAFRGFTEGAAIEALERHYGVTTVGLVMTLYEETAHVRTALTVVRERDTVTRNSTDS